jgi:hypothetical protein
LNGTSKQLQFEDAAAILVPGGGTNMRMKHVSVFVGGPIQHAIGLDGCFADGCRTVIERVISGLTAEGHKIFSAHLTERFGEMDVSGKFQEVCARDYRWMRQCDVFVALLPLDANGDVIVSNGTSVELGWASAMGKPIVIVCDSAPKYSHLIIGLDAIARVVKVDIGRPDLAAAVCDAIDIASSGDGLRLVPLGSAR